MYDSLKEYEGKIYSGMKVGNSHLWKYSDGKWYEVKEAPDRWNIQYNSVKTRLNHKAPKNSGAKLGTKYHWYILADQIATKLDSNSYQTSMNGLKFKIGHKRPYWRTFSYNYPEQDSYKQKIITILEETLRRLKEE
jgi:hypothetical protein